MIASFIAPGLRRPACRFRIFRSIQEYCEVIESREHTKVSAAKALFSVRRN